MIYPEQFDEKMDNWLTEHLELPLAIALKDAIFQQRIAIYSYLRLEGTMTEILKQLNGT